MLSLTTQCYCLWGLIALKSSQAVELVPVEENATLTLRCPGQDYHHRGWYQGYLDSHPGNTQPFYKQVQGSQPVGVGMKGLTLDNDTFALTIHQVALQQDGANFTCRTFGHDLVEVYNHSTLNVYIQPQIEMSGVENMTFRQNTKVTVVCCIERLYPKLAPDAFLMYWGGHLAEATEMEIDNDTFRYEVGMTKVLTAQDDQVIVNCSVSPTRGHHVSVGRRLSIMGADLGIPTLYLIVAGAGAGAVVIVILVGVSICLCRRRKNQANISNVQTTKYAPTKAEIEESTCPTSVYETLDPGTKNSIDEWLDRNRVLPSTKEKLRRQDIKSIQSMQMLSPDDIAELGITIGERNRLKAALATLQE